MKNKINIVFEKDDQGYYAYTPAFPGCHSQGDTFEEAMDNIKEAIELYLEVVPREEIEELLSKEILTTTLEVQFA